MTQPAPQTPYPQANASANPYTPYTPYGYYPWYPPAPLPPTPPERPTRPGRARIATIVIAVGLALVTLGALALAALAPSLIAPSNQAPEAGLSQVYSAQLTNDASHWDISTGCIFADGGLHALRQSTATLCDFRPDGAQDLASTGFYAVAEVGPAAAVSAQQKPCIEIRAGEDVLTLAFDQQGAYGLELFASAHECAINSGLAGTNTYAWHTNGITPNRIAVRYDPNAGTLAVYVNGSPLTTRTVRLSSPVTLRLGASADGEAIFTRFSLYT